MSRMRWWVPAAALCLALPSHAATWSIGPSMGFDLYTLRGQSYIIVTAPSGTDVLFGGYRPGLRLGAWDQNLRHQVFSDFDVMTYSGSGLTLHALTATINYAYAFGEGSAPYVTAGLGFANLGADGNSDTATMYGLGVGGRHLLSHRGGSIRVEARFDRANPPGAFAEPVNILGMRVGFDLHLN